MRKQPILLLQITDQHLFCNTKTDFLGINTYHSFRAVIELMKKEIERQKPRLVIFTGDISQDGSSEPYQYVAAAMRQLACDVAWIPGNHDNLLYATPISEITSWPLKKSFSLGDWQIILLNSHWSKHIEGRLSADELWFLDQTLHSAREKQVIIFIHHHVVPIKCQWLDSTMLANAEEMLSILDSHKNIKAVFSGHIHQDNIQLRHQIQFISAPSTCIQFKKQTDHFMLDSVMPGFRRIELHADGILSTGVMRIADNPRFIPDLNSKGY